MCVQDVKIGRNTEAKGFSGSIVSATAVEFMGPDADRIAVLGSIIKWANDSVVRVASIGTMLNGIFCPLMTLSVGMPSAVVTIEEVGVMIQGALMWQNQGGDTVDIRAVAIRLRTELDKI